MTTITMVPVDAIDAHPHNPRRTVGDVTELVESIAAQGIRQNLLVVPHPDVPGRYRVVIGHRRLEAAKVACLPTVPAVVDDTLSDAQQIELMLVENLQRVDLTPIEEAKGYQDMLDLGIKVREIVRQTGRSERTVTGRLKLLRTPDAAQEQLHSGQTTIEDVLALADCPPEIQDDLVAHLGSRDFEYHVINAKATLERERENVEKVRLLEARGVTAWVGQVPRSEWVDIPGYERLYGGFDGAEYQGELPPGSVYINDRSVRVYRPRAIIDQPEDDPRKAERARQAAEDQQLDERARTAWELRSAFVAGVLARKLSAPEKAVILEAYLVPLRGLDYDYPSRLMLDQAKSWLGEGATAEEAREYTAQLDAHKLMLLAKHYEMDESRYAWRNLTQYGGDALRTYQLLTALGYVPSTIESEAIALGTAARDARLDDDVIDAEVIYEDEEDVPWVGPSGHVYKDELDDDGE